MRTTCSVCQTKLDTELERKRTIYADGMNLYGDFFTQADCRLCGQRCCNRCLTLDSVCDTCLQTMPLPSER